MQKKLFFLCFLFTTISLKANVNIKLPTIGGKVFWTDVKVINGWRIQQNVFTGHFRLLNPNKIRYNWGSLSSCINELKNHTQINRGKKAVFLIHGLGCRTESLNCLIPLLQKEGFQTIQFGYSTFFEPLENCAEKLNSVIQEYEGDIYAVTHSMGGILLRQYQKEFKQDISGAVMLAAPNQGAKIVNFIRNIHLASLLGVNGKRLHTGPDSLPKSLPSLNTSFITIAGTKIANFGHFPIMNFIEEENDGFVSEKTTHLKNEQNHLKVKAHHLTIMKNSEVQKAIISFLTSPKLKHNL